jgi:hypothetical protein
MKVTFNPTDAAFLEDHYGVWIVLKGAGYVKMLDNHVRSEFLEIYRRNLDSRALYCLTCQTDLVQMVKILFINYDRWKEAQLLVENQLFEDPATPDTITVEATDAVEAVVTETPETVKKTAKRTKK